MEDKGHCPKCRCEHPIPRSHAGKAVGAAIGATLGRTVDRSLPAALIGGLLGALAGEIVDREIVPKCPTCGTALELIRAAIG